MNCGFLSRSKSVRICEYFNNILAEIRIQKTVSDYTRQLKGDVFMSFSKVDIKSLEFSPVKEIGDSWGILTGVSDEGFNSMTVSWGSIGVMWNRPCVFAFVRPVRHTYKFMEAGEYFSLAIMDEEIHPRMTVFGRASGRDVDKYKESGFTVAEEMGVKFPDEAQMVFICRKISAGDISPEWFVDPTIDEKNYPNKDYHRMYIGEILQVLKKN